MSVIPFILAAGSLPALIFGAPLPSHPSRNAAVAENVHSLETREIASAYTVFGGTGLIADGWPSQNQWVSSFEDMFNANKPTMSQSCHQFNVPLNSDAEIQAIHDSILSVSHSSGVDPRFILAIIMQESNGCVRVPTTNGGVRNPGLMQDHNGKGTCNDGTAQTPCPSDQILQMIKDGTEGTIEYLGPDVGGPGLQQLLNDITGIDGAQYYQAARMYNSGSIANGGNLGAGVATHCYSSDVANRLLGWSTGESKCNPATIGTLSQAVGSFVSGNTGASSTTTTTPAAASPAAQTPATTTTPAVQPTTTPAAPAPPASTATTAPAAPASSPSSASGGSSSAPLTGPKYPGAVPNCKAYVLVVSGDYCQEVEQDVGISASQFLDWNPGLNSLCSNLWLGYEYCIKA